MTVFFLGLLVLAWAVVVIPSVVRARRQLPMSSAERFRQGMGILAASLPGKSQSELATASRPRAPELRNPVLERRRLIFTTGVVISAASLVGALIFPATWNLHLVMDAALAGYTAFLLGVKRRREEARHKIASIRPAAPSLHADRQPARVAGGGSP